jgi:hypothetical protein
MNKKCLANLVGGLIRISSETSGELIDYGARERRGRSFGSVASTKPSYFFRAGNKMVRPRVYSS